MNRHTIVLILAVIGVAIVLAACSKEPVSSTSAFNSSALSMPSVPGPGNAQGNGGTELAYYDSLLFTINESEMPAQAAQNILAHNPGFNFIYELDEIPGANLIDVLDAIPTDGMNPLWREVLITFNGTAPHQFFSDDQVNAAAAAGEITLDTTDVVYRCSVIGQKPK